MCEYKYDGRYSQRPADSRPALPGHHRALSPALRELVRLLAEKAVEEHIHEAGAETKQQSLGARGDDTYPDLNEATSAQAGQSVQEGRSHSTCSVGPLINGRLRRNTSDQRHGGR